MLKKNKGNRNQGFSRYRFNARSMISLDTPRPRFGIHTEGNFLAQKANLEGYRKDIILTTQIKRKC